MALVEVLGDPAQDRVAEVFRVFAATTDIVDALTSPGIWTDESVLTEFGTLNTSSNICRLVIAALDFFLALWNGGLHSFASRLIQDSTVPALSTGHGRIRCELGVRVGHAVSNKDRLELDIGPLFQDVCCKYWNVVTSVRFSCDMEVLEGILRKLLEEQGQESKDILRGRHLIYRKRIQR